MTDTVTIYHNPRCSKSRQTLALIEAAGIAPEVVLYLETPPTATELQLLLNTLEMSPRALLRKGEQAYKDCALSNGALSDAEIIDYMVQYPKLIERPIVTKAGRAILGRPPENVNTLIG
ncbi:arsenate reductase (glutaredoxin) [Teredinibacter purpureus]|uniref:arsenate reductase (glutaredoxin) n=1 Tax=Teredinibacter purpureus TaxID=2731756 RepID=UPI0005F7A838|nr:arsenate reductase (glutaredoxin) [Teredinibacter purpureus]